MKRVLIIFVLVFAIFSIASILLLNYQQLSKESSQEISESQPQQNPEEIDTEREGMKFRVTVPENAMEDDTVWIYFHTQEKFKMNKVDEFEYEITLTEKQLQPSENRIILYRYSRNGYDFHTAEYLEPDTNDYFWTQKGRTTTFKQGKVQQDIISRWRWFPEEGSIIKTTSMEPQENFLLRINNIQFRSGQTIEDLYVDAFHDFFNSTAQHMKEQGYTWVELEPPWQWVEENGLPRVHNDFNNNPNYPDDETFLEELKAYKGEGLKVLITPQICCAQLDTKDRPKEWWDVYFDETEKFLMHFATLAEEGKADAFMYAVPSWGVEDAPIDIGKKWSAIFSNIKKVFHGEVGEMIWVLGPDVSPSPQPIPDTTFVTWGDALDFFLVATDFPLSPKDNPTDEELKNGARQVVEGVKEFYDRFQKPIIIRNGYFNVKYSWKGQTFYEIDSIPWISDPEAALQQSMYEFNTEDQARTVNAYFQAIAERPWVIGYFHFGYTHWEDPLSPWMSIRGKPAEDLWRKWNEVIYSSES